jgi:hypothetical protein
MRYIFLLLPIVLASMCTAPLPDNITSDQGTTVSNEEIYLNVNALPSSVSSGGQTMLYFQIMNNAPYDLTKVKVHVYDTCIFTDDPADEMSSEMFGRQLAMINFCPGCSSNDILKSNHTKTWSWKLTSGETILSRDCQIKFRLNYTGRYSLFRDVGVLSESEYNTRLRDNTLSNIPLSSSSSNGPLKISLEFTETQPFLTGTDNDVEIKYTYTGDGFIAVKKGSVKITLPPNLEGSSSSCRDYDYSSGVLTLNKDLKFIGKEATPSICSLKAKTTQPMEIKALNLEAAYSYYIDSSVLVSVRGTSPTQPSVEATK